MNKLLVVLILLMSSTIVANPPATYPKRYGPAFTSYESIEISPAAAITFLVIIIVVFLLSLSCVIIIPCCMYVYLSDDCNPLQSIRQWIRQKKSDRIDKQNRQNAETQIINKV